jgi:hypothetical protein
VSTQPATSEDDRLVKIKRLCEQAIDYSFPAGQAQAGIQFGTVEVPWLLAEIARLKAATQ